MSKATGNKNIDINKIIDRAVKKAVKEMIEELNNSNLLKKDISYFKKVELLLYHYSNLKDAIKQKNEDIRYIQEHGLPEASGSVVVYKTSGGSISTEDRYLQLIEKYKIEKIETERELNKIENALKKIEKDKYYNIVYYKYLAQDKLSEEEIAERLGKDRSTITRNKSRLINNMKVILFPESINDFAQIMHK